MSIFVMDKDGSKVQKLVGYSGGVHQQPRLSLDGTKFLVTSRADDNNMVTFSVQLDGTRRTRLSRAPRWK